MIVATSQVKETKTKLWLWGLSALYLIGYFLLMRETKVCVVTDGVIIRANCFFGFWDQYLACRSINELGDALAGAFAPVAFIWLAGAVQIQSQELAAQREELSETRDVMREQLEATRAQVAETKASTELFRKQTEMAEREHQLREEAAADQVFDRMFLHLREVLNDAGEGLDLHHEDWTWELEPFNPKKMSDKELYAYVNDQFEAVRNALEEFSETQFKTLYFSQWQKLRGCLCNLVQISERSSASKKLQITLYDIEILERDVDEVTRLLCLNDGTNGAEVG